MENTGTSTVDTASESQIVNLPEPISKLAPFADKYLGRFVSKKLSVFVIACLFLWLGKLSGEQWMWVASIYLGGQATIDAVLSWKAGGRRV